MANRCNTCGNPSIDEIIERILSEIVCPGEGLDVDVARRCLRVLLEPGGGLQFGPLGGLRVSCCDGVEPIPGACVATIDTLGDFVIGGNAGGAYLLHPQGSPQALDYVLAHSIDMVVGNTWSTQDEVAVWQVYGPDVPLDVYTTSPTTATGGGGTSSDWIAYTVDAGTTASPTGRNAYAPESVLSPDGGWYGWYAPQYNPLTLDGMLRRMQQRIVSFIQVTNTPDGAIAQRHVMAAIRAINAACTHASTILAVNYDMAGFIETIANAQITPAIFVDAGETDVTAAMVAATGVEWVRLSASWSEAQIQPFIDAGLQVLLLTGARHWSTLRAQTLGARGVIASDPVYARGALGEVYQYYRRPQISYVRRQTALGHLTTQTDVLGVVDARGFTKSTEYGLFVRVTEERPRNSILIGEACPLPDPANGSYTWEAQVDASGGGSLPVGESPKIGVTICSPTDADTAPENGNGAGYAVFVRVGTESTGQLEIGKITPGAAYQVLATSATSSAVPVNDWMTFRLEVSPTAITFTRTDGTAYSVTTTDTEYRGPYVHWLANKVPGNPAGDFVAGVRQWLDANADALGTSVPPPPVVEARRLRDVLGDDATI